MQRYDLSVPLYTALYPSVMEMTTVVDVSGPQQENKSPPSPDYDFVIVFKAKKETGALEIFLRQLKEDLGLKLKTLNSSNFDKDGLVYGLISAPRKVLEERAEKLKISIPLQRKVDETFSRTDCLIKKIKHYFAPSLESGFFKIPYDCHFKDHISNLAFAGGNPFTCSRIRIMLIYDLIKDIDITEELEEKEPNHPSLSRDEYRGIKWLKEKRYIEDSFALHDKEEVRTLAGTALSKESWYRSLSLTSLRNYFGDKIGMSFAWRSAWLSNALLFPIIMGLVTIFYGITKGKTHHVNSMYGSEIEDRYLDAMNNRATPYYALLMCIWAAIFPKIWSNFKYIYSFKWGTVNYHMFDERVIAKFASMKERSTLVKNLVYLWTWICTFLSIIFGVFYCLAMIYIQMTLTNYFKDKISQADLTVNAGISLVNTILVNFAINPMFEWTSLKLTNIERHHFESDFERALTVRVFFNSFFNNNIRILMMLIVPQFSIRNIFSNKTEQFELCKEGQCAEAIGYQVAFFLLLKPILGLSKYAWHTVIVMFCKKIAVKDEIGGSLLQYVEKQHRLFSGQRYGERFTTMDDMNTKVAQYGFVVMFAAAFPLAPLIAFLMEYFVRRADIDRYLKRQERPIPRRQEGIGNWEDILEFVNMMAICTNVWIITFRSNDGFDLIINWKKYYPEDYEAMLAMVLISSLVLLTSLIRALTEYNTIPQRVKIYQREEEKTAEEFLHGKLRCNSSKRGSRKSYVSGNSAVI